MCIYFLSRGQPVSLLNVVENMGTEYKIITLRAKVNLFPEIVVDLEMGAPSLEKTRLLLIRLYNGGLGKRLRDRDSHVSTTSTNV
jgi:hypothetical protein